MRLKSILLGVSLLVGIQGVALAQTSVQVPVPLIPMTKAQAAAPDTATPKVSPAAAYQMNHRAAVAMFTQFLAMLQAPENTERLTQLTAQTAKLADLEKAYATAGKDEKATKQAGDDYKAAVRSIVELSMPFQMMGGKIMATLQQNLGPLGPMGEKIMAEQDVKDLQAKIDEVMKPVETAGKLVGPLMSAASNSAKMRMQLLQKSIFDEELSRQISNHLQATLAK